MKRHRHHRPQFLYFATLALATALTLKCLSVDGESGEKSAIQDRSQTNQPAPPESSANKSQVLPFTSGKLVNPPSEADYLASAIAHAKNGPLINAWGDPDSGVFFWLTGRRDEAIVDKLKDSLRAIRVILHKRNEAVAPLPWEAGKKVHLKGLESDELAEINKSLQTALKGSVRAEIIEVITKRFSEESKAYTHSFDVEVSESRLPKGMYAVSGGRAYRPLWIHEIEKDAKGTIISDKEHPADNPGLLATQFIPTRRISADQN
jgi:hypothetical protein